MQIAPSDDVSSLFYGIPLTALRHIFREEFKMFVPIGIVHTRFYVFVFSFKRKNVHIQKWIFWRNFSYYSQILNFIDTFTTLILIIKDSITFYIHTTRCQYQGDVWYNFLSGPMFFQGGEWCHFPSDIAKKKQNMRYMSLISSLNNINTKYRI